MWYIFIMITSNKTLAFANKHVITNTSQVLSIYTKCVRSLCYGALLAMAVMATLPNFMDLHKAVCA